MYMNLWQHVHVLLIISLPARHWYIRPLNIGDNIDVMCDIVLFRHVMLAILKTKTHYITFTSLPTKFTKMKTCLNIYNIHKVNYIIHVQYMYMYIYLLKKHFITMTSFIIKSITSSSHFFYISSKYQITNSTDTQY